jgi:Tol biopolymer transport system component
MKSLFVFLTALFLAAAAAPAMAEVTTDYGTLLNVINNSDPKTIQGVALDYQWNPVWSPDGKTIAFTGQGGYCIYTVPATGGAPTLIYDNMGKQKGFVWNGVPFGTGSMSPIGFTPDGKEITFRDFIFDPARGDTMIGDPANKDMLFSINCTNVVLSVNIATGAVRTVVEEAHYGTWSPDGCYFVYRWVPPNNATVKSNYIRILDTKTGEDKVLDVWDATPMGTFSPNFTPDGKYVIYNLRTTGSNENIFRIPVTGGTREQITFLTSSVIQPQLSPDGSWLLLRNIHRNPGDTQLNTYLGAMNMKTGEMFDLFPNAPNDCVGTQNAQWSPDGKKIAYMLSPYLQSKEKIYIVDFPPKSMTKLLPTSVAEAVPIDFAILGNFPNPFNPSTTISFTLPETGLASLVIYNATGQKVRELASGILSVGKHSVLWDGRDQNGRAISSGVYISRLMMNNKITANRMLLVK